jgi:hypothetical protein
MIKVKKIEEDRREDDEVNRLFPHGSKVWIRREDFLKEKSVEWFRRARRVEGDTRVWYGRK